jgi:flagellar hook assembly protein FlgD
MLGQEVRTLLSQEVKAGRHSVEWKGDNNYGSKVSSGTYIYRISAGEYMQAKKMILLK